MTRHTIDQHQHHQPAGACASPQAVVFVFDDLHDWQTLAAAAPSGAEVVVLDGWGDGLAQMAAHLQGRSGIAALHVLSHGTPGSLLLGSLQLNTALMAKPAHAQALATIGQALAEDGDILVYGCRAGAGNLGADFVQALALATGAHVAAAKGLVGAAHLGGSWALDRQQGAVGTAALSGLAHYQGILAVPPDQTFTAAGNVKVGTGKSFDYNGLRYTMTGSAPDASYEHYTTSDAVLTPRPAGGSYLALDYIAGAGVSQVTVSAIDGSAFRLMGMSFMVSESAATNATSVQYTLTPQGGSAITTYMSDVQYPQVDFSSNPDFYNITSFTFSASSPGYPDIFVSLDDIVFATPLSVSNAPTLTATGGSPTFTEGGSSVDLFSAVIAATNDAGQTFSGMTLTVTNVSNDASEVLTIGGTDVALQDGNSGTLTGIGSYSVSMPGNTATVTVSGMTRTDAQMGTLIDGISYRNASQDPSATNRVVTITNITDSGGSNNTAAPNLASTVSITPVNDAPTASATGGTPTYTENGAAVSLFSGAAVSAVESGQTITSMRFTVTNLADGASEQLVFDGTAISLANGNSGTTSTNSLTYAVSVAAGTATVTLTKVAGVSSATAQTLLSGVTYQNTSEAPTTGANRVITLTSIDDNGGTANGGTNTTSLAIAATVTVVAVNDAPTLSGGPALLTSTDEDNTGAGTLVSALLTGLTHGDVDGPGSGVAVTGRSGNGTWQYSTDGVTWNNVGTVSNGSSLLLSATTQVRYVPDGINGETATLTVRAWDQTTGTASSNLVRNLANTNTNGGTTAFSTGTAQASISVSSVNDLPVDTTSGGNTAFLQGNNAPSTPVAVDTGFTVTDVDNTTLASARVGITGAFQSGQDELAFTNVFATMGNISGSYDGATGVMTLTSAGATATLAQWQAALRAVTYTNTSASPDTTNRTISFTTNDGSADGNTATKTVTVAATNQTPIATASGGTAAFTEGANTASTPVVVDSGLTVSDADNGTLASATVRITGSFQAGQDVLGFTNIPASMGNISASYNAATGELTLTSSGATATLVQWQAALRSVTYTNSSDTPNTANRTVSFTVNDGNSSSTAATTTVTVANRNDAPVNQVPAAQATPQNTALVFNTGNGNLVSISDADSGAGTVEVKLTATNGLLTLSGIVGLAFIVGSGTGDATMTFEGTLANINAALNGMGFTPTSGYNGMASIQIVTDDKGMTGAGGNQTDTDTISITVGVISSPGPTTPPPTTVDGVPVTTTTGPDGTTTTTIPVVPPTRPDTPGTSTPLADIPLVKAPDGHPIVSVSVPTGVGLTAEGLGSATAGAAALAELGLRIERIAGTNPELTNAGQVFFASMPPNEPLTVQILKPSIGAGYDASQPLVITGSEAAGDGKQAIILDARTLPSGTVIQVDNIDFIAVVGNVRLVGGAGQNAASGDGSAQWIVLGPDDDIIHGGGGNDTVGSEAGDDQVYGDAGDDIVFGGAGNDLLSGGTGSDKLNGGTGFDVAIQEGARSEYTVTLEGAGIKLTHTASGVSDWLVDVEQVRFATGPSLTVAHSAAEEAGAYLFQKWLGRDLNQGEGAIIQSLTGKTALEVATLFAQVFPTQSAGKTPAQLLEGLAAAGAIRVDAIREVTVTGDGGNNTITPTLGLARYVDGGAGTDTVVIPATLAQTHIQANGNGSFTLQRMTDGAMVDVTNVERLSFSDTKLALDLNGHAGQAAKLLGALAGPGMLANKGIVGEVIRLLDAGATSQTIAGLGLQLLGANTPTQVAQTLWTNVTGRAGTSGELKILTDIMAGGTSAADLVVMAANLDATAVRIDLVGLAAKGIEFA